LLLLDEPTNHLDLDSIEWLEGYLKKQAVPMVIVSHDRATLDQLCTKIVEIDMVVSKTFEGNYSECVLAKAAWIETQRMDWLKQQKEISRTEDLIQRLAGGANSGRAASAEKVNNYFHSKGSWSGLCVLNFCFMLSKHQFRLPVLSGCWKRLRFDEHVMVISITLSFSSV